MLTILFSEEVSRLSLSSFAFRSFASLEARLVSGTFLDLRIFNAFYY